MSCTCPTCRFCRKEITANEYAWYLKGCIEIGRKFHNKIKEAKTLEELKEFQKDDRYNLDSEEFYLSDLKKRNDIRWDLAFETPEDFSFDVKKFLEKEEKKDEHI